MSQNAKHEKSDRVHYADYLMLPRLLDCQHPHSPNIGGTAHDEMLFITVHQAHELWFKQMLFEIDSILEIFKLDYFDERHMGVITHRLDRVCQVVEMLGQSLKILETMTPLDFLEFRDLLAPASGFQSVQFRVFETKLGLKEHMRMSYSRKTLQDALSPEERAILHAVGEQPTLLQRVERWLERTPFLEHGDFDFWHSYRAAVERKLEGDQKMVERSLATDRDHIERQVRQQLQDPSFQAFFDEDLHNEMRSQGERFLSHKAIRAALFINLYRDEPLFQLPFRLLTQLVDLDELLYSWRMQHIQLVTRTIGARIGTGGSAGIPYLQETLEKHRIFKDFALLAGFMIPRSALPPLPGHLKRQMGFQLNEA